ncbi:DMT family transporter [Bacillus massilinigeriensis]|uniref:DMT family transporter n=1 Tax=Bacillus mediterraneensis TaxID=1805474 RepID=UPI000ACF22BF|nr:EamA family transporter [Bacillus mediterraneensis]
MGRQKGLMLHNGRLKGFTLVIMGAGLWGISGTVVQYLFDSHEVTTGWLVNVRLLASGLLLLLYARYTGERNIWRIWKDKESRLSLLIFGIIGMLGVQYTFFSAIEHGNAATAAVLQYLAPVLITCYLAIRSRKWPTRLEILSVIFAITGTILLVTRGNLGALEISFAALIWGLASALTLAFYTLQPGKLLSKWGSVLTVGWGMMIGGICSSFIHPPWRYTESFPAVALLAIGFVIFFGTLVAFYSYMESLNYISASETSLLASVEPLSAAFLAVIWLRVPFGPIEWLGSLLILSTIFLLSKKKQRKKGES